MEAKPTGFQFVPTSEQHTRIVDNSKLRQSEFSLAYAEGLIQPTDVSDVAHRADLSGNRGVLFPSHYTDLENLKGK